MRKFTVLLESSPWVFMPHVLKVCLEILKVYRTPQYPDLARGGLSFRKTKTDNKNSEQPDLF